MNIKTDCRRCNMRTTLEKWLQEEKLRLKAGLFSGRVSKLLSLLVVPTGTKVETLTIQGLLLQMALTLKQQILIPRRYRSLDRERFTLTRSLLFSLFANSE